MKKIFILILCGLGSLSNARAQEYITLEKALKIGLENNYSIRIAENERRIVENNENLGEAGLLPVVDASAGRNSSIQNVIQRFRNDPEPVIRDNARSTTSNSVVSGLYILDAGSFFTLQRLGTLSELSRLEAKVTIENTISSITTAYYRLVLEQQRYVMIQNTLELSEERRRISKDKYELGRASKQEYLAAQVDYNTDLSALINQEEIIATSRIQLNELLGRAPQQDMIVRDTIIVDQEIIVEDLLGAVNLNNPQLLAAQRQINVAHLQVRELQAQRLPQLEFFGSYSRQLSEAEAGFLLSNRSRGFNYGVTARVNLFNGFVLNNRVQSARIREQTEELRLKSLRLELESDIREVYTSYSTSLRLLEVAQSNYNVAIENADIALERYKLGNTSALEFREAQQNALAAESQLINALFNIKAAEIELNRLAGTILEAL